MKFFLSFLFSFYQLVSFGQTSNNTGEFNTANIYYQAIVQYYLTNHPDKNSIIDTIYLKQDALTDSLVLNYSAVQFIKLNDADIKGKALRDTNFTFLRIYPLEYSKGFFYIPIKQLWVDKNQESPTEYIILNCVKMEFKF